MTQTTIPKIRFVDLKNYGDTRGFSFTVPPEAIEYVGRADDIHLAAITREAVRGNHYHLKALMAIVVLPGSKWSFHWDEGENTQPQHRAFDGSGAVLILIAVGSSHALRNEGDALLWYVAISSEPYDPADRIARKVL